MGVETITKKYSKTLLVVLDQINFSIFHAQISHPRLLSKSLNQDKIFGFTHDETVKIAAASQRGIDIAAALDKYVRAFGIQFLDLDEQKQNFLTDISLNQRAAA
ncbi:hypothetical protein HUO09_16990 [Vibrio sp. Y2-5]|uniref:hypothetical protein n=1 Tax=Vibrio sp. Y2-5 TaxID=2743977 RepID=UPI001660D5A1|nr:hypothetical protein [Vibrio sp. Y2-5]MBD0788052.1 hypothetical protein [Vibrio sp. Y2-5]